MHPTTYKPKQTLWVILLLLLFTTPLFANKTKFDNSKGYLVLMHPTVSNIKCVTKLIDKGVFSIRSIQILGIYHKEEATNYKSSIDYITNNELGYIKLYEVESAVSAQNVFDNPNLRNEINTKLKHAYGMLFMGGPDIPAKLYNGQQSILTVVTDPYRHYFEISTLANLLGGSYNRWTKPLLKKKQNFPIYAFCLGAQSMNVATGGTLIQDIPSEIYQKNTIEEIIQQEPNNQHKNYDVNRNVESNLFYNSIHQITLQKSSYWRLLEATNLPRVLSAHHQAIGKLGQNIDPIATSIDGKIIEAIRHTKFPRVIGFQFHPERTYLYSSEEFSATTTEKINPHEDLKKDGSLEFHYAIWRQFSMWVKEYRAENFDYKLQTGTEN